MVLTEPERLVEKLRGLPMGARLLSALAGPPAEPPSDRDHGPSVEGPLPGVFLVGGAVRDLLLEREPRELDLVVEGDAEAVADELRRRLVGRGRTHARFGTASIAGDGVVIDVAAARTESYARPGALPDVAAGAIEDDLRRRDFSVNAIALGISTDRFGELHAWPTAADDLEAGLLRVLHDRSFLDDPTRLLRLVRYAARLGFAIEPETERLAREAFAERAPGSAGVARMGRELLLLLDEDRAIEALLLLRDLAGDDPLVTGLKIDEGFLSRVLAVRPDDVAQRSVLLAAVSRGTEHGRLDAWLAGMHVPAAEARAVLDAARDADGLATALRMASRPSEIALAVRGRSPEAVVLAGAAGAEDEARTWLEHARWVRLSITGSDLLAAGVRQGRDVGRRLDAALAAKLDGEAATREEELAAALSDPHGAG